MKIQKELKVNVGGAYDAQNPDDKSDKNLQIFYGRVRKIVAKAESIRLIDPFDRDGRKEHLEELVDSMDNNRIKNPEKVFQMQITSKSR